MSEYQKYEIIEVDTEPYAVLAEARELWHSDLEDAAIALAWEGKVKMDTDGHVRLGKCVKVTELYREFADFNFIIVLNREVWADPEFTKQKKIALMDHELCHAAPAYDEDTGYQKMDAANRLVWRVRRHDIEEFRSVVAHHGCYKADLEKFAETLLQKQGSLLLERSSEGSPLPLAARAFFQQVSADSQMVSEHASNGKLVPDNATDGDPGRKTQLPSAESSTEERARTRKNSKKMQGQDAILPNLRPKSEAAEPPQPGAPA